MEPALLGYLFLVVMLILMFSGVPTAIAFFTCGFFGMVIMGGFGQAIGLTQVVPFFAVSSFDWIVIPLFMMMGVILFETRIGEEIFKALGHWLGQLAGGMAAATSGACAFIGTMTGSGFATSALMSKIAYPEMRKFGYQPALSLVVCCASSTAAMMIPPSILMVLYGVVGEVNIGDVLLVGFIPGFMSMGIYIVMILIRCHFNPSLGPPAPPVPWRERFKALRYLIPAMVMMVTIVGGLFIGVFTASEAAGVGTFIAFTLALVMRRVSWKGLKGITTETARIAVLVMVIIVCVRYFTRFLNLTGVTLDITRIALGLPTRWITLAMMMGVYFIFGMFIGSTLMYITVPIFVPVIIALGFDPVWFGILTIKMSEMGTVSPPVCNSLFIAVSIIQEVPIEKAYVAVIWFLVCDAIALGLLIAFPQISLVVPQAARAIAARAMAAG